MGTLPLFASQTYAPPPPPKIPLMLSEAAIELGKSLFEDNVYREGKLETHNYLGPRTCASCHDKTVALDPESISKRFRDIRSVINQEIVKNCGGKELPLQDPALEALVQYIVHKYKLQDYKLLK